MQRLSNAMNPQRLFVGALRNLVEKHTAPLKTKQGLGLQQFFRGIHWTQLAFGNGMERIPPLANSFAFLSLLSARRCPHFPRGNYLYCHRLPVYKGILKQVNSQPQLRGLEHSLLTQQTQGFAV